MANNPSEPEKFDLVDNPNVIEIFGDDFVGFVFKDETFRFTFAVHRATDDEPPKVTRVVSARLVLSLKAGQAMYNALNNLRELMKAQAAAAQNPTPTDTIQ